MREPQVRPIVERRTHQMHCSDFCSDSTIKRTHPDTTAHTMLWELNALSSEAQLSRNMLREVGLMSWAQEVWSSNLHAPTTHSWRLAGPSETGRNLSPLWPRCSLV